MKRHFAIGLAFLCISALCASSAFAVGVASSTLIPESAANAAGMTRAWFAQASLDRGREEITTATFQDGVLYVTSESGTLQAFNGETGETLWTVELGAGHVLAPGVNSKVVAAIAGTNMVVLDRFTGKKLSETELYGNPSAAPIVSEREIYVPMFSQRLYAYPIVEAEEEGQKVATTLATMKEATKELEKASATWEKKFNEYDAAVKGASYSIEPLDEKQPYSCASFGVPMVAPVMGSQSYDLDIIGWTTDQGWLILGEMVRRGDDDPFKLLYKLQARPNFAYVNESRIGNKALIPRDDVESSPFFVPEDKSMQNMRLNPERRKGGMFIIGSQSGHVYAMNDVTGALRWTYLTRTPVSDRISAFDDHAYVPTESGELYAVELKTGNEAWKAVGIAKTIAASKTRLYAVDHMNRLAIVNRANGERQKTLDVGNVKFEVFNQENDRVYVVSADGLIQCLHETQQVEPLRHRESCADVNARIIAQMEQVEPAKAAPAAPAAAANNAAEEAEPAEVADPNDDPFADEDAKDVAAPADDEEDDDPFGGSDDEAEADDDATGADDEDEEDPFGGSDDEAPFF